jgi:hypothetical protein
MYLVQLLLLSLLLYPLVLSQELLIVIIVIIFGLRVNPRLLFLLLVVRLDKGLGICIFREWIISQIDQFFSGLIGPFDFFLPVWLVVADNIDIIVVNRVIFMVSDLFFLDNLDLTILLSPRLRFSLHQL